MSDLLYEVAKIILVNDYFNFETLAKPFHFWVAFATNCYRPNRAWLKSLNYFPREKSLAHKIHSEPGSLGLNNHNIAIFKVERSANLYSLFLPKNNDAINESSRNTSPSILPNRQEFLYEQTPSK